MKYVELVIMIATLFLGCITVWFLYLVLIQRSRRDQESRITVSDKQSILKPEQPESFQSKEIQRLLIALDHVNPSLPGDAMGDLVDKVNHNLPGLCVNYREEEGYYLTSKKPKSVSLNPFQRKTDALSNEFDPGPM